MVLTLPVYSLRYGPNVACLLSSFSITTLRSQLTTLSHTVKNCSKWSFFFDCRWWHYWSLFPVKSPETILSIGDNLLANRPKYRSEIFSPISGIFQQFCVKIWPGPGNSDGGKKNVRHSFCWICSQDAQKSYQKPWQIFSTVCYSPVPKFNLIRSPSSAMCEYWHVYNNYLCKYYSSCKTTLPGLGLLLPLPGHGSYL